MDDQKTPPGNRVTQLSFSLVTQQFSNGEVVYRPERREYVLGINASGEDVLSLWCEIAGEYMTVTKVVAPLGSQIDLLRAGQEIIEWVKTTGPRRKVKKGSYTAPPDELEAAECAEANKILSRMWNHVESMKQRRVIYKISEVTGPIEWTAYTPKTEMPKALKTGNDGVVKSTSKRSTGKKGS